MKKRIFLKQWLELKPYNKQTPTDVYYLDLTNQVNKILDSYKLVFLNKFLIENETELMACFLVSYFEDIISETNIWNSFSNKHKQLYNNNLPFYHEEEYFENEINEEDVLFLIWYFLNTINEDDFISPSSVILNVIASEIMKLFDSEYEYAPENSTLRLHYQIAKDEADYYKVRKLIENILFHTYLFFPDTAVRLRQNEIEIIKNKERNNLPYLQENRDSILHKANTRLLSLKGKEWAAEILGVEHPVSADLLSMSNKILGYFLYKYQDENNLYIEHIASGKKFKLTKKSIENSEDFTITDTIVFIGIVLWRNEWWFSGIHFQKEYDADFVRNEKNSHKSKMAVNFLDFNDEKTNELLSEQLDSFLSFNKGSILAFMPTKNLKSFSQEFIEYHNDKITKAKKQKNKAKKPGIEHIGEIDLEAVTESGLFFFNSKGGGEMAYGINSAFPLKNNPFYLEEDSEEDIMFLLGSEFFSTELAMYCINNFKNDLPFFKKELGQMILENIDFLLRFWKKENYHTIPAISFVDTKE